MLKAIKIKIYPTNIQKEYLQNLFGCCRFVYNHCLDYKTKEYNSNKKSINFKNLGEHLIQLKQENDWLYNVHSKVLQQSLIDLNQAFKNFYRRMKNPKIEKKGYPKFKSKNSTTQSCRFPIDAIGNIKGNRINITKKLKDIHFKCSEKDEKYLNKFQENIKSGTLTMTKSKKYFFSILLDIEQIENKFQIQTNNTIGIDLGIKEFVITSEGELFENIKIKRNNQKKLSKLHRELSRKQKGSNNRNKSKIKLARFYEKLNNQKEYYLHQVANSLLSENQTIIMENLNVDGMLKNHKLARSIQELSLSRFKQILQYKANWHNKIIIEVDRFFPSSKLCHICHHKNNDLTLDDRTWTCKNCGTFHDRDINAAINILEEGKKIIGMSSSELTLVESSPLGSQRNKKEMVIY